MTTKRRRGRPKGTWKLPDDYMWHLIDLAAARRDRLIALLRKSIELNEPLLCSL